MQNDPQRTKVKAARILDLQQQLMVRSATDLEFRRKLLATPKEAIEEFAGRPVGDTFNMRFVENVPGTQTFVLPDPVAPAAELSSQELESVAGGTGPEEIYATMEAFTIGLEIGELIEPVVAPYVEPIAEELIEDYDWWVEQWEEFTS